MNPYEKDATYSTPSLLLRRVRTEDAEALLACYSDPAAVARMNADNCSCDFHFKTVDRMREYIGYWLKDFDIGAYVRYALIPHGREDAIGTVEMFGTDYPEIGRAGIMRIDLASAYEKPELLRELVTLGIERFLDDFDAKTLLIMAGHTPERAAVLADMGFKPTERFRPGKGYYAYGELN